MNGIQLAVPVFYPMAGALLTYLIGRKSKEGRNYFADFIVITEFLLLLYGALRLQGSEGILEGICGMACISVWTASGGSTRWWPGSCG